MFLSGKSSSGLAAWVCLVWTLAGVGCGTIGADKGASGETPPQTTDFIQVGDVLKITLGGPPEFKDKLPFEQKVKEDGTITLPYVGAIKAAGKKVSDLEKDIRDAYVPKYYKRIDVAVTPDNRYFYVYGEVKNPSRQPHVSEITVTKAIAAAGGFTDFAKKTKVIVTRGNGKTEVVNCEKALQQPKLDLPIYPGDVVTVKRRIW